MARAEALNRIDLYNFWIIFRKLACATLLIFYCTYCNNNIVRPVHYITIYFTVLGTKFCFNDTGTFKHNMQKIYKKIVYIFEQAKN